VFIEKPWLIESLRSHFRKYEIVKGMACPGLHRQRRCDIIARWRCRCTRAHVGNIAARVEDAVGC